MTDAAPRLSYRFAREHGVVEAGDGEAGLIYGRKGADPWALVEARRAIGRRIRITEVSEAEFERRLSDRYSGKGLAVNSAEEDALSGGLAGLVSDIPEVADLLDARDDAPIIKLINGLITEAVRLGASDVHLEPYESHLAVRLRIDGVLREIARLNPRLAPLLTSRVKVMTRLDIAERRVPQDGRISLAHAGRTLDVRVSTLPAKSGERVVLRLLDREKTGLSLGDLGMPGAVEEAFRTALKEPNGIILVTGPTGSGKTTSLYAGLRILNEGTRSILTIEDPIEYAVDGVGQTQVNAKVGMTFAAGLRAILRQDPDIVMVGEIRDAETAQIAVQASLTGHLVLSTVHTNDAVGAVTRLRDMGVEPFLLASTLRVVVAQRLVRRLCPHCRTPAAADAVEAALVGLAAGAAIFRPNGCAACGGSGYQGRVGVYELVRVDEAMRKLISAGADETELAAHALAQGRTLAQAARDVIEAGGTSIEEAVRVIRRDAAGGHADI